MAHDHTKHNASYEDETYNRIHRKTWTRRTAGFLAGATMFGAFGAVGGLVLSVLPSVLAGLGVAGATAAAAPSGLAILGTAAVVGGAAAWLGLSVGADVGANAGAVSAAVDERNHRLKKMGLDDLAHDEKPSKEGEKESIQSLVKKYNWKAGLILAGVFAAFGALVALSPITAPVIGLLGLQAGTAAASITCAATFGLLGTTMGVPFSGISNRLSNHYTHLLTGEGDCPKGEHAASESKHKPKIRAMVLMPSNEHHHHAPEHAPQQEASWSERVPARQSRDTAQGEQMYQHGYTKVVRSEESKSVSQESETIIIR